MKAIVCEMCNSNDIVKEDGIYVCKSCGTKYSLEEAKKLMVEIDNSKKMNNLYERARKSIEVDDLEHAAEYYKQILDENPDDWEAYFYSYLGETMSFTNAQASGVAVKLGRTIPDAYDMALNIEDADEIKKRFKTISEYTAARLLNISLTGAALLSQYEDGNVLTTTGRVNSQLYNQLRPTAQNTIVHCVFAFDPLVEKLVEIHNSNKIDDDLYVENVLFLLRSKYKIANIEFKPSAGMTEKLIKDEYIYEIAVKIKEFDPTFDIPENKPKTSSSSSGCYVATAVYGSYDCPQVWTLRRYRDYTLAETWYGRAFIHTYYAISPTIVKLFGDTKWFKNMWRGKLDRMVERLNESGVENTPYEDKSW